MRAERRCALGLSKAHSSQRPAVGQPERQQYERWALDVALDALDNALNGLIDTYAQRLHDALDEACGRLLKGADQPSVGGVPASVIVTITLEELLAKAGLAETSDGGQLSSDQLLRIADEAEIWPTIIDPNGVPLALGRSQRLASRGQTMALIARDSGCSFPGCNHPPQWCDRHHILDWILGGLTDLDNLTMLCRYRHTHFLQIGWLRRINPDGLPEWIPPRWIDRDQRPQVNARIRRLHAQRGRLRRGRTPAAA